MPTLDLNTEQYEALRSHSQQRGISPEALLGDMLDNMNDHGDLFPGIVHMLSHDLRTPLATVMSSSDLIKHYHDRLGEDRLVEHIDTIQTQVRLLDNHLDNLTLLLKTQLGLLQFEPQSNNPESLCLAVIQRMIDSFASQPEIVFQSNGRVSDVVWDHALLRLVLSNVLVNAVKFSTKAQAVYLLLHVERDRCRIEVRDSGIGIPAEALAQLGQPFFRASNVQDIPGYGLGLTVVRSIVDLHRGDLTVESELDSGTCVTITLPNGV